MKSKGIPDESALRAETRWLGLAYGLLGGGTLAFSAWGMDGVLLAQSLAMLPWTKLVAGGVFCLFIGGLAGWVTGIFDRAWVGLLAWCAAAGLFAWFSGHLPFEGFSVVYAILFPEFRWEALYPFGASAQTRTGVVMVCCLALFAIAGGLQTSRVDAARSAAHSLQRWLSLGLLLPFFLASGFIADNLINRPLREPLVALHQLFEFTRKHRGEELDKRLAREMRLSAIRSVDHLLDSPRRLVVGDYELAMMDSVRVYVDFDGTWVRCWTIVGQPSFCQPSNDIYLPQLACLLQPATPGNDDCELEASDTSQTWVEAWRSAPGNRQTVIPEGWVSYQVGNLTLVKVQDAGGSVYECRIRETPELVLESCAPLPIREAIPSSGAVGESTPALGEGGQAPALLPWALEELPTLGHLPHYALQLDLDYEQRSFRGQARIDYTNNEEVSLDSLYFRLLPNGGKVYGNGSLSVEEAAIDGQPVQVALSQEDTVLELPFPQSLPLAGKAVVEFVFQGVVPLDFGGGETPSAYGIYNTSEGVMALAGWYPVLAVYEHQEWRLDPIYIIGDTVYSDAAFYTVEVTASGELALATTGVETSRQEKDGRSFTRFVSGPARDFFIIASPDFIVDSEIMEGIRVNSYYLPDSQPGGRQALEVAIAALQSFDQSFGPYPFTELDVVQAPLRNAGGVEYPGIVLVESQRYREYTQPVFIITVAHEVAHQWWYNVVGNDVINEPWLDEALATYSSGIYYEHAYGSPGYRGVVDNWSERYERLLSEGGDDLVTRGLAYFESQDKPGAYGGVVYTKGALFFHHLRQEIGDEAFFAALQAYYHEFRYRIARGEDLRTAFETAAGRQLDDLYAQWLYSAGAP